MSIQLNVEIVDHFEVFLTVQTIIKGESLLLFDEFDELEGIIVFFLNWRVLMVAFVLDISPGAVVYIVGAVFFHYGGLPFE